MKKYMYMYNITNSKINKTVYYIINLHPFSNQMGLAGRQTGLDGRPWLDRSTVGVSKLQVNDNDGKLILQRTK